MDVPELIAGPVVVGFIAWLAWITKAVTDLRVSIAEIKSALGIIQQYNEADDQRRNANAHAR